MVCCSSSCCCLSSSSDVCSDLACRFEPAVRFLQFSLSGLQFLSERLRLLEQFLGSHVRFDRIDNDTDRLGQLIEESELDLIERNERRKFDDGLDLAFEQHGQHDDICRSRFAEAGIDLDVVRRYVIMMIRSFSSAHWPMMLSPKRNSFATDLAFPVRVACEHPEDRFLIGISVM